MEEPMMTAAQVAERLGVHSETLRRWAKAGMGPPCIKVGGTRRYPAEQFQVWLAAHAAGDKVATG